MFRILGGCCHEIALMQPADFDGAYKEPISQILQECPALWRMLWLHRHRLFDPQIGEFEVLVNSHDEIRTGFNMLLKEIVAVESQRLG